MFSLNSEAIPRIVVLISIFSAVHIGIPKIKPTRCTNFSNLFLE